MTRILSELLEAQEPQFSLRLKQLERINGHNNVDIRLSVEVTQAAQRKVHDLGLDKHDTTGQELYQSLMQRVSADDARLERVLRTRAATHISAEADVTAGIVHVLQSDAAEMSVLAMKPAVIKRLLKKMPPKRLQKTLGYRSLDAMLRQEPSTLLAAVARQLESAAWRRNWHDAYKQLQPSDFENRSVLVLSPADKRWQQAAQNIADDQAHTLITLPELGSIIVLPLPTNHPAGMVMATLALALHDLNTISATSTYLQASQVHGDFGQRVQAAAKGQIQLEAAHMPQALPWHLVQRHFTATQAEINEDIFGPYVQSSDFSWRHVERRLAELCPSLAFWQDSAHISFLATGTRVSLNLIDAAVNCCNNVAYDMQQTMHAQQSLWNELLLRYLDHRSIEQAVASVLQPSLALETAKG
jgi:hypothetical protein